MFDLRPSSCGICLSVFISSACLWQEETQEYLDESKLRELIAKYSEFIEFPIYLYASKEVDVEAAEEDEEEAVDEVDDDDDVDADTDEGAAPTDIMRSCQRS